MAERPSFDDIFTAIANSRVIPAVWSYVYGDDYPAEASAYSFVTTTELNWMLNALDLHEGDRFVDLGCGSGGVAAWIGARSGARAIGIDRSALALATAGERNLDGRLCCDATAIGVRSGTIDGVASTDVLQLLRNPQGAIGEVARVLKPGRRFVFTAWECPRPEVGLPPIADFRPLLERAGFGVTAYLEPIDWRERQLAVFHELCCRSEALVLDVGPLVGEAILEEARAMPAILPKLRRVNVAVTAG